MGRRKSIQTLAVLATLLRDPDGEHYGLELARDSGLATGTIYPILAGLEQAGWVQSAWEHINPAAAGRPARRYYRLTVEGERAAAHSLAETLRSLGIEKPAHKSSTPAPEIYPSRPPLPEPTR